MKIQNVEFRVITLKETDKAVLFDIEGEERQIPKSIIDGEWPEEDDEGEILIPEWFVIKESLV